ncbi:MAG TPA: tRNA (adenosine(37)-N6)-dimethylallyltransferase MiaA [Polyangiaceae bacterium]|nr:tRNA (adenosine(37)-N6)-dimethylallyltransferase MiaA [Polyangiaceae bacterium]
MSASFLLETDDNVLLCVVGPTASQKTALAIRLCEQWDGEVIGADSVQIYQHFDIGSGKPTARELAQAAHHLVGIVDPREPVDAARYAQLAEASIRDVRARGKVPIVCGGTFLWVRSLVYGLAPAPPASPIVRKKLDKEREQWGDAAMHARLQQVDPITARRLNPRDWVRVQRALEVFDLSGRPLSEFHQEHQRQAPRYQPRFVGIRWTPAELETRIRHRVRSWLASGWIEEVESLIARGYRHTRPMASVGYRQIVDVLEGRESHEQLLDQIVRATKVFARRQRTWLREVDVQWLDPDSSERATLELREKDD